MTCPENQALQYVQRESAPSILSQDVLEIENKASSFKYLRTL
jgi:hypothetical protein